MKPISKKLLIHEVNLVRFQDETGWGSDSLPSILINNVRVDPVTSLRMGPNAFDSKAKNVLFIDATYSLPFVIPKTKDIVHFDNDKFIVSKVSKFYDVSKLHHLEIVLE